MRTNRAWPRITAVALSFVAGAAVAVGADQDRRADERPGERQADRAPHNARAMTGATDYRSAKWMIGLDVVNSATLEDIAEVSDLIVDRGSGRIERVALKTGSVMGLGGRTLAVPYSAFSWTAGQDRLALNATKDQLKDFPEYSPERWNEMRDRSAAPNDKNGNALYDRISSDAETWGDPYAGAFKDAKRVRVEGEVRRVERIASNGMGEQTIVTVAARDGGNTRVALGPSWFLTGAEAPIVRGDTIAIDAYRLSRDDALVATNATIGNRRVALRHDDGRAVWSGREVDANGRTYGAGYWRYTPLSALTKMKIECRGQECGAVDDVILERRSGMIAFVSIDPNENFLGIADTKRLAPWSIASVGVDGVMRIDASKDMVLAAPEAPKDLDEKSWTAGAERTYRAYDVSPPRFTPAHRSTAQAPRDDRDDARWRDGAHHWSSNGPIMSSLDPNSDRTVKGTLVLVETRTFDGAVPPAKCLVIKTDKGEEKALLGPAWHFDDEDAADWQIGKPITVEVRRAQINGDPYWIATSCDHNGTRTTLIERQAGVWERDAGELNR